jgi:hypothetical protein
MIQVHGGSAFETGADVLQAWTGLWERQLLYGEEDLLDEIAGDLMSDLRT